MAKHRTAPFRAPSAAETAPAAPYDGSAAPHSAPPGTYAPAGERTGTSPTAVMQEAIPPPVETGELAPVMATDGSGLPFELWRGLDVAGFEKLISEIEIPPRSAALHSLWKRLITSDVTPPSGETSNLKFSSLRLEALYRSGLASEAGAELAKNPPGADPVLTVLAARTYLATADREKACTTAQALAGLKGEMPKHVRAQGILINGYCAAAGGDIAGAGLAAELAREEGISPSPGLDALDALSVGAKPKPAAHKRLDLLDYRLLELAGTTPAGIGTRRCRTRLAHRPNQRRQIARRPAFGGSGIGRTAKRSPTGCPGRNLCLSRTIRNAGHFARRWRDHDRCRPSGRAVQGRRSRTDADEKAPLDPRFD